MCIYFAIACISMLNWLKESFMTSDYGGKMRSFMLSIRDQLCG